MNNREFERFFERLMKQDLSVGTETFREELLARCLDALNTGDDERCRMLDDSELELLSAAGDTYAHNSLCEGLNAEHGETSYGVFS